MIFMTKSFFFSLCVFAGRVHSAMVSKLNPAQRSVTVEWYERGETKGKEVELDVLLELNPELIRNKQTYVAAPPPTATSAPINLQRVSRISSPFSAVSGDDGAEKLCRMKFPRPKPSSFVR